MKLLVWIGLFGLGCAGSQSVPVSLAVDNDQSAGNAFELPYMGRQGTIGVQIAG